MPNRILQLAQFHSRPSHTAATRARLDDEHAGDGESRGHRAARRMQRQSDHPAAPEQIDHGFEDGFLREPRSPDTRRVGRFSTGVEQLPSSDRRGRFSEGIELLPETPEKRAERRFSEGIEHKLVS